MWLFKKKKKQPEIKTEIPLPERLENGELPFGWTYRNREFVERIQNEYTYFLNRWLDSRTKAPIEQYAALKSFVMYMEDVKKLCGSKGECFEFWFNEVLTGQGYLEKRKKELLALEGLIKGE